MKKNSDIAYRKLAEQFRREILSGKHKPGYKFPGEPVLAGKYGVSRITVRLAMQELESEALIYRRRGSGTYVSPNPQRTMPVANSQFSKNIKHLTPRMRRTVLDIRWAEADKQLAIDLNIPHAASVLYFSRIDKVSGKPMAIDEGWIFGPFAHKLGKLDLTHLDFFEHWQKIQEFCATKSILELAATAADRAQAEILNIRKGSPLLVEKSCIFAGQQGAAKFTTWYRHDMYKFKNTIHFFNHKDKENDEN